MPQISYNYKIGDSVWTHDGGKCLYGEIIQITFDIRIIDGLSIEKILYHILTTSNEYQAIIREEEELFNTKGELIDHIVEWRMANVTPTPTPTVTPTMTVTPNPTPLMLEILDIDSIQILDAFYQPIQAAYYCTFVTALQDASGDYILDTSGIRIDGGGNYSCAIVGNPQLLDADKNPIQDANNIDIHLVS